MNQLDTVIGRKIEVDLGHLLVYRRYTTTHPFGDGKFYYTDKRFQFERGPFDNLSDCVVDWSIVFANRDPTEPNWAMPDKDFVGTPEPVPNNVIRVDFKTKKRIP